MKKLVYAPFIACAVMLLSASCDQNASKKEIGNSKDTNNVTRGGGPPIRDTSSINKDRQDSVNMQESDSTRRGNVDPGGHANTPR